MECTVHGMERRLEKWEGVWLWRNSNDEDLGLIFIHGIQVLKGWSQEYYSAVQQKTILDHSRTVQLREMGLFLLHRLCLWDVKWYSLVLNKDCLDGGAESHREAENVDLTGLGSPLKSWGKGNKIQVRGEHCFHSTQMESEADACCQRTGMCSN